MITITYKIILTLISALAFGAGGYLEDGVSRGIIGIICGVGFALVVLWGES